MKVGVLTSSRADFGIYLPLLKALKVDATVALRIIAFGTHCSKFHGETVREIRDEGFTQIDEIKTTLASDDENSIATSYGLTVLKFADYWNLNKFDLVFCLGDRYEMSAAVQAGIPFRVRFAHLHGGEDTLGAIDNIYRHQITLASTFHFTSTDIYADKVKSLIGTDENIFNVGALSLDGIKEPDLVSEGEFRKHFKIPLSLPYLLITFHPETMNPERNEDYAKEMFAGLGLLAVDHFLIVTMPNADTRGSVFREYIQKLKAEIGDRIITVENFGKKYYFTAMEYSKILVGNTSSGIIEAASFKKFVVNVGDRQKGRAQSQNIINADFNKDSIVESVKLALEKGEFSGANIYYKERPAMNIINAIKEYFEKL